MGCISFAGVFFCFFFGQAKKKVIKKSTFLSNEISSSVYRYYMRYVCTIIFMVLATQASTQSPSMQSAATKAADIKSPSQQYEGFAALQSQRWQQLRQADPHNAIAWWNNYLWTGRDKQSINNKQQLDAIASAAKEYIANTAEYAMIAFLQGGEQDSSLVNTALRVAADRSWIYPYAIRFAVAVNDQTILSQYCHSLEQETPLTKHEYNYHYNVLMSADSGAVIYARGLNDLVPLAIMQNVHGIRKDIQLRYYKGKIKEGAYLCLTLGSEVLSQYSDAVYTGLLVRKGGDRSLEELRRHVENDLDLESLDSNDNSDNNIIQLYQNYFPGLILLYQQYKKEANSRATKLRTLIQQLDIDTAAPGVLYKFLGE
jgi:hypothetical protein